MAEHGKVRNALLLALLTTVAAYFIMMLAPFPGIRQMAVFAAAGLSAACLTVLFWHPWLCRGLPVRPVPLKTPMLRWLAAWRDRRLSVGLPVALTLVAVAGIATLRVDDDIAQPVPCRRIFWPRKTITALTGQSVDQKWFVVHGASAQQTLERLEAFTPALAQAQQAGELKSWRSLPLNSLARQARDLALLHKAAPAVIKVLQSAGLTAVSPDLRPMPVEVETWLASPASEGWRLLWLTLPGGESGVLVPVDGVKNSPALGKLAAQHPGVVWVDRKARFDSLFALYRNVLTGLLAVALAVIAGVPCCASAGARADHAGPLPAVAGVWPGRAGGNGPSG